MSEPGGPPGSSPPAWMRQAPPPRPGARGWGPGTVFLGLLALVFLTLVEAIVVFGVAPAPPFQPDAIAAGATTTGEGRLFVLNGDDDSVWVMEADGDDALRKEGSIPVASGSTYLAAGTVADGQGTELAVAGRNDKSVQRIEYHADGSFERLPLLRVNPPGNCAGPIRKQRCTGVRSLAIGDVAGAPAVAVGTLGGQVRVFETAGSERLRLTITLRGNHRIAEAVAAGDANGDGVGDLLVRGRGGVVPYLGRPDGTVVAQRQDTIAQIAQSLAIGGLGVAVAPLGLDTVQLYRWTEGGGFAPASSYEAGDRVRSVTATRIFAGHDDLAAVTDEDRIEVARAVPADGAGAELDEVADFEPQQPLAARIALQGLLALTLVGVAFAVANPGGGLASPWALGLRPSSRSPVGSAVVAYLVYFACAVVLSLLIHPEQRDVTRDLGFGAGTAGDVASALLVVAAAPVSEEVFFRGFMFGGLRRRMPFAAAAVISAGIWGVFHYTGAGSWGVVLQLSIFGVILAWLYQRTGSIWPAIAVHVVNNVLAFALLTS